MNKRIVFGGTCMRRSIPGDYQPIVDQIIEMDRESRSLVLGEIINKYLDSVAAGDVRGHHLLDFGDVGFEPDVSGSGRVTDKTKNKGRRRVDKGKSAPSGRGVAQGSIRTAVSSESSISSSKAADTEPKSADIEPGSIGVGDVEVISEALDDDSDAGFHGSMAHLIA